MSVLRVFLIITVFIAGLFSGVSADIITLSANGSMPGQSSDWTTPENIVSFNNGLAQTGVSGNRLYTGFNNLLTSEIIINSVKLRIRQYASGVLVDDRLDINLTTNNGITWQTGNIDTYYAVTHTTSALEILDVDITAGYAWNAATVDSLGVVITARDITDIVYIDHFYLEIDYSAPTKTVTPTVSQTATETLTVTQTATSSISQTVTETITETMTQTETQTVTQTSTETATGTVSQTVTETNTQTITATATRSVTGTVSETATGTNTRTITETATQTVTSTVSETVTGTNTQTVTQTTTKTSTDTVTKTATQTITETATQTVTQTITQTATATSTFTPSAYGYIEPNYTAFGQLTGYTYRLSSRNEGPITSVLIKIPAGVNVTGGLSTTYPGATAAMNGADVEVTYAGAGWNVFSDPNFDIIKFSAISDAGLKTFTAELNGMGGAVIASVPTGYSQAVLVHTSTVTQTVTETTTQTVTHTITETATQTVTQTVTKTMTQTMTQTTTQTVTQTVTETMTQTMTQTVTETATQTVSQTITLTVTETVTKTITETVTKTNTQTITDTATQTVTQTITQTATPTSTFTPSAYGYIEPNYTAFGQLTGYTYRLSSRNEGPITSVLIKIPAGVNVTGGLSTAYPGATAAMNGTDVEVTYPGAGWNVFSDPNFDVIEFSAISDAGLKTFTAELNGMGGAVIASVPTGYSQAVLVHTSTATQTVTETMTQTVTQTVTETATQTVTKTVTQTVTESVTQTATQTVTETLTQTVTRTVTETMTQTATQTVTETTTQTVTETITQTVTKTVTETITQTVTQTVTETITQTATQTVTETATQTATQTVTETTTQTVTETATQTVTRTVTETTTQTATETVTETTTQTVTKTVTQTATQTITETATQTVTQTITQTATPTSTFTPAAYGYIQPNYTAFGQLTGYTYRLSSRNEGPITSVLIKIPAGVNVTGGLSTAYPGAIAAMNGADVEVTYPGAGWNVFSDPNFDVIEFSAISDAGLKTFTAELNGMGGAVIASVPTGYSQAVLVHTSTVTQTVTQTATQTATQTVTETVTETVTQTITQTVTQTITQTATQTVTETVTQTVTQTITQTVTQTVTETATQTVTQTVTQTATQTVTETVTQTVTRTASQTMTQTITQTITQTTTETITQTVTQTATETMTQTATQTVTETTTRTVTQTITETVTETITQTVTETATQTSTSSITQTVTETVTQTVTQTITQTATPSATQTATQTVTETVTVTVTQTATPTSTQTATLTITSTVTQTATQTATQTITLTVTQTTTPSNTQTITQTITQTVTETVTPTVTMSTTPTVTPTNTAIIGMVIIAPGQSFTSSAPGYTGVPDVQEAGRPVTITVRMVEQNNWTMTSGIGINAGIESSQPLWTLSDTDKNMSSGEAQFVVRFLKPGLYYSVTAVDRSSIYPNAVSDAIPVTVSAYGNLALSDFTQLEIATVREGASGIPLFGLTAINPNSGGPEYRLTGLTLTISTQDNQTIRNIIINDAGGFITSTAWGVSKTLYVPVDRMISPAGSIDLNFFMDIKSGAPAGKMNVSIENAAALLFEKLDDTRLYSEAAGAPFPYISDSINIIGSDINTSFYNYPNPFSPLRGNGIIQFFLPETSDVKLDIFDITGRKVRTLADTKNLAGGVLYKYEWDGKNNFGTMVVSGVYYGILKINNKDTYRTKIAVIK